MKKIIFAAGFLMLLSVLPAHSADQGKQVSREGFTFVLPEKWSIPKNEQPKGRRDAKEKILFMTKDGVRLDRIEFRKRLITAELPRTKKRLTRGMMPQEIAEVVLSDFELNDSLKNFRVIENKPATLSGMPGFKLVFSFRSNGLLQYQCVYYGVTKDDMLHTIFYMAPRRHYYDTNLATFEQVVKSYNVEADGPAAWGPGGN